MAACVELPPSAALLISWLGRRINLERCGAARWQTAGSRFDHRLVEGSNGGREYLSVKLDDPSFNAPSCANPFNADDGYSRRSLNLALLSASGVAAATAGPVAAQTAPADRHDRFYGLGERNKASVAMLAERQNHRERPRGADSQINQACSLPLDFKRGAR